MTERNFETVKIVHDFDTGQSWNELDIASMSIAPSPERYLYDSARELAEERRAHREARRERDEALSELSLWRFCAVGFAVALVAIAVWLEVIA